MNPSARVEFLTKTFSADQNFCDYVLASEAKRQIAEMLVYQRWAATYMNDFQEALSDNVAQRFGQLHRERAQFWTLTLMGGVWRDINLACYLSLRGLVGEARAVLRRALESIGVLSHLWQDPAKAGTLEAQDTPEFRHAFHRERQKDRQDRLKDQKTLKRFEHLSLGEPASQLYAIFSRYGVHGGSPDQLIRTSLKPTRFSCSFENRPETVGENDFVLLAKGCEILCVEVASLGGQFGDRRKAIREGGATILVWLSSREEFTRVVDMMLTSLTEGVT